MLKIFKHLAKHWAVCLVIVGLLIVQAWCDLSLPGYTSQIVDVGIQQGGVESALPETIRADTLKTLMMIMPAADAEQVDAAYGAADAAGVRTLQAGADRTALEPAFTTPDVAVYMAAAQSAAKRLGAETATPEVQDLDAVNTAFAQMAAVATPDMIQAQLTQKMGAMDDSARDMIAKQAVLLVQLDYEAQGISQQVQMNYLWSTGAQMLAFSLLMVVAAILVGLLASRVAATIGRDLRRGVFEKVVSFSNAETDRFSTASLITRTTNDIQQVQQTSVMLLRIVAYAPILGIGGIWRVAHTTTGLTWIIAVAVITLLGLVAVLMSLAMPKFRQMQNLVDRLNLVSREILTGIMPIRAFSREKFEENRFDKANTDLMRTQLFTNRVMTVMMPAMMLIMNGVTLLIVWFGGKAIDAATLQVGDMIAFISYTMQIVMSFLMLTVISVMLPRAGVAADRIDEVLTTNPVIHDPAKADAKTPAGRGVLEFHGVNFRYPGAESDALEEISFVARPGETTAVIGSTGCGKSTLLNLIPRFYDVSAGSITIDGVDVREMPQHALHEQLGYVPQKGVLFSGTVESNIKFGGEEITDQNMTDAAAVAQAQDFITAKEQGYQSPIAQGGSNVSGGQKQRLSIARAVAKAPKIYLFDDSFSALDYKTDVAVRRALKEKTGDATVLIVAQRISTVLHANRILVLEDGRIVGSGTHAQLMQSCPQYQEIAKSQLSQKELDRDILKGGEA